MTLIQHLADIIGAGLLGAFLVAAFCLSAADRRGYNRAKEEQRLVEGVALARPLLHPLVEEALPEALPAVDVRPQWRVWRAVVAGGLVKPSLDLWLRSVAVRVRRPDWPRLNVRRPVPVAPLLGLLEDVSGRPASVNTGTDAPAGSKGGEVTRITGSDLAPIPIEPAAEYAAPEPDRTPQPGDRDHPDYPWVTLPVGRRLMRDLPRAYLPWADIAKRLRHERITTPTAEFVALVGASWTPEETAALTMAEMTG